VRVLRRKTRRTHEESTSVEQILRILGEIERSRLEISDACRPHEISERTYYRWRNSYGGLEISEARCLRELETENGRLKKLVVDQDLGHPDPQRGERRKW
jgi:putative transposase